MNYEEFKKYSGRGDIDIDLYEKAIEPLYLLVNIDKQDFCKLAANLKVEILPAIATLNISNQAGIEKILELETSRNEIKAASEHWQAAAQRSEEALNKLTLQIAYVPDKLVREVRADLFLDSASKHSEAVKLGIIQ